MFTTFDGRLAMLLLILACHSFSAHADDDIRIHTDLTYTEANPDWKPFSNGDGYSVYAEAWHGIGAFGAFRYTDARLQPSGPVNGGFINYWQSIDVGYRYGRTRNYQLEARLSYQQNERELPTTTQTQSGLGYEIGGSVKLLERLRLRLNLSTIDIEIKDWTLRSELQFDISDRLFLIARLRDYNDWDFTYYEAGIGLRF